MPKRTDIHKVLIIGSGPIVIGQACEFDYSGTQACKALRSEGYEVVLVNSNPATIMTDPEMADRTYVEPLTVPVLETIIARERPDALLPTVGGQTALNLAVALADAGVLDRYGVCLIGAGVEAMRLAENRLLFKQAMTEVGLAVPRSGLAYSVEEALAIADEMGYPVIVRPSFTLGGSGGGLAYDPDQLREVAAWGLHESPANEVLVEESVLGWKEYELEVMRDGADNFVVVCSIENFDPMGVHTGDSITVAPAQTLSDKEYQRMRDAARLVIGRVGVETGGANIQFAVHPDDGRMVVIEMNPRVSRSSALASKATGFPIAKIAAKLAVGYRLDEIPNDITRETPASFEPTIDYVVVKVPRWDFAKFPGVDATLGPQMKSVGEAMAIGRTFKEALQKGLRSLEIGADGLDSLKGIEGNWKELGEPFGPNVSPQGHNRRAQGKLGGTQRNLVELREARGSSWDPSWKSEIQMLLTVPTSARIFAIGDAFRAGVGLEEIRRLTDIDPWFLRQVQEIIALEAVLRQYTLNTVPSDLLRQAKRFGFSDAQLADLLNQGGRAVASSCGPSTKRLRDQATTRLLSTELAVRQRRESQGTRPVFCRVDTCAAEFEAYTPYLYSTYGTEDEAAPTDRPKVMILGGGPNRIGQGIEFDYCCCHASFALRDMGYETIMVNCNPETVSTDYDTSDRLYFEPLTLEAVLNIAEVENPDGMIVQLGGQTPLKLAIPLQEAGVPIWGTSPDAIDLAEDRERFGQLLDRLGIPQPPGGTARSLDEAIRVARTVGYPVLVRPSYVLGGRAMAIVYDDDQLAHYMREAVAASPEHPVLLDRFLEDAYEVDVDAVADGERVIIGGIMQHIEEAGIHSGDSACVLPPYKIHPYHLDIIRDYTRHLGKALNVVGLMNVQYAIKDGVVYVLEVNPRASRTVPFVSKATGVPLARLAAQVMGGLTLAELGFTREPHVDKFCVKEAVLPFIKFPGADSALGPEMRSTGEVMGISPSFGGAFAKAQSAVGLPLPDRGTALVSVNDNDKGEIVRLARDLHELGFDLLATCGTAAVLRRVGLPVETVRKGDEPADRNLVSDRHVIERIECGDVDLIINTPFGKHAYSAGIAMRQAALKRGVHLITTLSAAAASIMAVRSQRVGTIPEVRSLQEYHNKRTNEVTRQRGDEAMGQPGNEVTRQQDSEAQRHVDLLTRYRSTRQLIHSSTRQLINSSRRKLTMHDQVEKVVLAYSGGLDTSVILPWLKENYGCEVVTFSANIGQGEELEGLEEKALASGASKVYIEDLREEFVTEYIFPTLQAGAIYERKYLLGTSFARPIIARRQVEIAELEGADAVAHGCTGKGNDQVRFELTYKALSPKLKVIAPWREWEIRGREDALRYAAEHGIPVAASETKIYSRDRNLWHLSHEGGPLEDPWWEPEESLFQLTCSLEMAPDEPGYVEIEFREGIPKKIDGVAYGPVELVTRLNALGGQHGIGRVDIVENRLVGMKSRGVYETPGGTILSIAHRELESLCLDRETLHYKDVVAQRYAELVYYGQWYTPLREALDAFVEKTQENVTGTVRVKLYKGNVIIAGRTSPHSLYREDFATFGQEDVYDQSDAVGFINLFGLPMKVKALTDIEGLGVSRYRQPDYSKFKRD